MFDKKIQEIADIFGNKLDDTSKDIMEYIYRVSDYTKILMDDCKDELSKMSKEAKIAMGISIGLSAVDTILLFAILKKLGR